MVEAGNREAVPPAASSEAVGIFVLPGWRGCQQLQPDPFVQHTQYMPSSWMRIIRLFVRIFLQATLRTPIFYVGKYAYNAPFMGRAYASPSLFYKVHITIKC